MRDIQANRSSRFGDCAGRVVLGGIENGLEFGAKPNQGVPRFRNIRSRAIDAECLDFRIVKNRRDVVNGCVFDV